jgi:hypothetical protein
VNTFRITLNVEFQYGLLTTAKNNIAYIAESFCFAVLRKDDCIEVQIFSGNVNIAVSYHLHTFCPDTL